VGDGCLPNIKEMESLVDFDRAVLTRRREAAGLLDINLDTATPGEAMFTAPGVGPVILESKGHLRCSCNHRLL
jgi:hypothetical protein